jgi:hypothetical protein
MSKPRSVTGVGMWWIIFGTVVGGVLIDIQIAEAYKVEEVQAVTVEVKPQVALIEVVYNWTPERLEQEIRETFKEAPNTAVAIAKAEGGLKVEIRSQNKLSYGQEKSYCTFQIHAPDHDATAKKLGLGDYRTNPKSCVKLAYHIYKDAGGFSPWTEYRNGGYKKYL